MATLAQVVGGIVNNDRSANYRVFTKQLDESVLLGTLGYTIGVRGDVTQITSVSFIVFWGSVVLSSRIEVRTS